MGPVNRIPPQLLGVLGLQQLGRNVQELAEYYQPAIEMRDWLLASASRFVYCANTAVGGPGSYEPNSPTDNTSYVVPQGEAWLLYGMFVTCTPAVNLSGQPYFVVPSNAGLAGGLVPVIAGSSVTFSPTNNLVIGVQPTTPIFLPPGSRPRFNVDAHAGAGQTVNFFLHYARLVGG